MGCSVSVCDWGYGNYIVKLEQNLIALRILIEELEARRDDLVRRVAREEVKGLRRLARFQVWVSSVESLDQKFRELFNDPQLRRNRLSQYCSVSRYKFGKRVYFLLRLCERLISQGDFEVVAERPIYTPVLARGLVGQDRTLEKIRQFLMENETGILGLYGMGGVGKTALLTQLYNVVGAEDRAPFDTLIWTVVSLEVEIHRIQDDIAKSISLYNEEWGRKSEDEKALSIHRSLRKKKYLLMLDDLWDNLNIEEIGVPLPTRENESKIVFTTRSMEVCRRMGAYNSIEVRPLEKDDAWDLFRNNVGETTLQSHPEITGLARRIADRCSGLPLALKVVGASMASITTKEEWHYALDQFICPVPNPADSLLLVLKHSYNALNSEQAKLCFLFCALFPEDQEIRKEDLIELWRGEGIIDENNIDRARNQGYMFIGMLIRASLLMDAGESGDKVVLHRLLRDLALHIASHPDEDGDNLIVESYTHVGELSKIKNWRDVGRVSLVGDDIKTISGVFDCPKLKTLLIRDTKLETISPEFFSCLPALLVLDLSSNKHLNILPDAISELVSLQYLNLSSTGIKRLPLGLSELKRMTFLNLEHTHMLTDITRISDLVNIQALRLCDSGFRATCSLVEELQLLEHLELLTITLQDEDVVQLFISCPKLAKCTQGFYLNYCPLLSTISITSLSGSLRCLDVQDSHIPEIKIDHSATGGEAMITMNASPSHTFFWSLNEVRLDGCSGLRELTWLLFAPSLVTLRVVQSRDVEEIISKEKAANLDTVPFPSLKFLALEGLDKLRSIYWKPLPLPKLREIRIRSCPGLTKLPVNSKSAEGNNLVLSAEKELMQRIEWEDSATKQRLFPSKA